MMCMESALSIAKLIQLYEIRYALRRINVQAVSIVCSAALLLIFANVTRYYQDGADQTGQHLSACFRALEEFASSWESAKRARDLLLLLQRQWELRGRTQAISSYVAAERKRRKRSLPSDLEMEDNLSQMLAPRQRPDLSNTEIGLDLDWIVADFPFTMPQDSLDRL